MILCFASCNTSDVKDDREEKYNNAMALINEGKYLEAYEALKALGDYKDAKTQVSYFRYVPTKIDTVTKLEDGAETGSGTINYSYNRKNLLEKFEISSVYSDGTTETRNITLTYDDNGKLIHTTEIYDNVPLNVEYIYDAKGNLIEEKVVEADGKQSGSQYTYDEKGNLIKLVVVFSDGSKNETEHFYDANGNLIKKTNVGLDFAPAVIEYTYDATGKQIKKVSKYSDGREEIIEYFFDENDNVIRATYVYAAGMDEGIYTYDANGNMITEDYTFADGSKFLVD
jgi:antitoxin component YwqK of YwqJK toxin-antitoxin module